MNRKNYTDIDDYNRILREGDMKPDFVKDIISKSVTLGKGGREKYLKAYVRFFNKDYIDFLPEKRLSIKNGNENEFKYYVEKYEFYFDLWEWGVVIYHTQDEEGTQKIEQFINSHPALRMPWLIKKQFYRLAKTFEKEEGKITNERALFKPHKDYSGYGEFSVLIRGKKTNKIITELEERHALHPRSIGIQIGNSENSTKFEMTNRGRISFSSGSINSRLYIIGLYVDFIIKNDEVYYEIKQSHKDKFDGYKIRKIEEISKWNLPSIEKIKGTIEERNNAIINLITSDTGTYGYMGIPLGNNRANVLDLKEGKFLQVSITDNTLYIYSENPSKSRSAIRRLASRIACHIDPDVGLEKVTFGG